jgi:hypothetical protein
MKRLTKILGHDERLHTYFWVTGKGLCWDGRASDALTNARWPRGTKRTQNET